MTTTITTASGHTITYAPACRHCGWDRNPVVTDVCGNKECEISDPHEMPGEQLDRTDIHIPTALRLIERLRELNAPWVAHIMARELSDNLPGDGEGEMTDEREAHVAGLRELADVLERNPQIKSPFQHGATVYFYSYDYDAEGMPQINSLEKMKEWRRAAGGTWNKEWTEEAAYSSADFKLTRMFGGLKVTLTTPRENVCEKVVVETITETVMEYPAEAFVDIEKVAVEKKRDIIEWVCPDTI